MRIFAADIDIAVAGADRVRGNCHALDQQERIALHHHAVGKGCAVAFIGVAHDVFARALCPGNRGPLDPGGKARTAAPAQARLGDFGNGRLWPQITRAVQPDPAPGCSIIIQAGRPRAAGARKCQALLARDERMRIDPPDRQRARAGQHRRSVIGAKRAKPVPVDFGQRLQPVHPPARHAFNLATRRRKGCRHIIGATGNRQRVIADPYCHAHATCSTTVRSTSAANRVVSSRA